MAAAPLPFERALLKGPNGHAVALGLRHIGHGDNWVELALDYDRRLISDLSSGILASGPIVSAFDTGFAAAVMIRGRRPQATLDLRVDYLRPAAPGRTVIVHCLCYRLSRRIAFVRGFGHDGDPDRLIAHATGTFMIHEVDAAPEADAASAPDAAAAAVGAGAA